MTTRFAALVALVLGTPVAAQDVIDSTVSDLNGDGLRERFTLLRYAGAGTVDLIIEDTGTGRITARDVAGIGGTGQEPELDLAPNGSVRLTSMNESIGRDRWRQTLTLAWRDGAYRVAGYTYRWYDTLDLDRSGKCDLNLLTGKGFVKKGQGATQTVAHGETAVPVTDWTENAPIPPICQTWD